jgi:hypothetical protein
MTRKRGWSQVLASWRDGPARQAIIDFVASSTTPGSGLSRWPTGSRRSTTMGRCGWSSRCRRSLISCLASGARRSRPTRRSWSSSCIWKRVAGSRDARISRMRTWSRVCGIRTRAACSLRRQLRMMLAHGRSAQHASPARSNILGPHPLSRRIASGQSHPNRCHAPHGWR